MEQENNITEPAAQQPAISSFEAYQASRLKPDEKQAAEPVPTEEPTSVSPETTEDSTKQAEKPKRDRTAEGRIAELTARAKQLEAERDEWKGRAATPAPAPSQEAQSKPIAEGKPLLKEFVAKLGVDETYEDAHEKWTEALTDWRESKRAEREAGERQQQTQRATAEKVHAKVSEAREKHADFDTVTEGEWITPAMQEYLLDADNLDVIYHLGANRDEVARISALSKSRQIAELGKLEDRLSKPEPKQAPVASRAPAPIRAIGGTAVEPADPLKASSFADYEKQRQKQMKR